MKPTARTLAVSALLLAASCAQVPKESVELSATVGRDLVVVRDAHRETAALLFERMKRDVDRFVDGEYAPYQIRTTLQQEQELFRGGEELCLYAALDAAVKPDASPEESKLALDLMGVYVDELKNEIESYRRKLLEPIEAQESDVLAEIDRSYAQLHYANSIVTGHLASIVKVHDAQAEVLSEFGIEGLREKSGAAIRSASEKLDGVLDQAKGAEAALGESGFDDLVSKVKNVFD